MKDDIRGCITQVLDSEVDSRSGSVDVPVVEENDGLVMASK